MSDDWDESEEEINRMINEVFTKAREQSKMTKKDDEINLDLDSMLQVFKEAKESELEFINKMIEDRKNKKNVRSE